MIRKYTLLICLMALVGCGTQPSATPGHPVATLAQSTQSTHTTSTVEPNNTHVPTSTIFQPSSTLSTHQPAPDVTATSTPLFEIPAQYDLDANLDYLQHTLAVSETISYTNYTPDSLNDLILIVEPNRWPGGFSLVSLTWDNGEGLTQYDLHDDQLSISLPQALAPGDQISLLISYELLLPEIAPPSDTERPQPYGYTARQTNIVDWYPYIPPYKPGEGWLVHPSGWFGEHQAFDVAEFQVKLTLAEPIKDLVIAASAPAEQDGDSYIYHVEAGRTFALSASDQYLVETTTAGDVTVYSYFFPYDKYSGQEALHATADALQLFSRLITPYPHATLSVVEADFLDGMEYDGLYFLSHGFYDLYDGTPKGYLTFIAAHETAHQWWYGLVGNDQALEPWLDEALCTYMEHIFYENIYADYSAGSGQSLVDWWWYYRVNFYDPTGPVDGTIYDFSDFRSYRNAVYLNGAKFLDALRNQVGDEQFFTFLREYALQNRYKLATASDFFTILRGNTNVNLDGLIAEYFTQGK